MTEHYKAQHSAGLGMSHGIILEWWCIAGVVVMGPHFWGGYRQKGEGADRQDRSGAALSPKKKKKGELASVSARRLEGNRRQFDGGGGP